MRRRKKNSFVLLLLVLLLGIGLGYALLTQTLNIIGSTTIANSTWDIHFDNVQVTEGSVSLEEGDSAASIDQNNNTIVNYAVTLNLPGDYYEFTVDVVNAGTIDGMVGEVISNYNNVPISTTNPLPDYLIYSVTYEDGVEIEENHLLEAGDTDTYRVRVEFDSAVTGDNLPSDTQTLNLSFGVEYVQADDSAIERTNRSLYGVLKRTAKVGTYAKKYTGEHQDSFAGTGTKDIYHWYSKSSTATTVKNMVNVIFAEHCWQMIRTTDTGGVKMLYNGEVENNQCLDTRGNHTGYDGKYNQVMNASFYYGTDYSYDSTNGVYSLSGTVTTGEVKIGQYTCRSTSETGTCTSLYYVDSYNTGSQYYSYLLKANSHYSQYGKIEYDGYGNASIGDVGYMSNYHESGRSKTTIQFSISSGSWTVNSNYYYSDTIDYGNLNAGYTLINPKLISALEDADDLVGKYVLDTNGTNSTVARYILKVNNDSVHYRELKGGDLNIYLTIGDSFTTNGNTYTLTNPVTMTYSDWYNNISDYSIYTEKYICDGNNISCSYMKQFTTYSNYIRASFYNYYDSNDDWYYSETISYNNGVYTLTGDIKKMWNLYDSTFRINANTHHYTCFGEGTSCETAGYVRYQANYNTNYILLNGEQDINELINKALYANDVNSKNSRIKEAIELWYKKHLLDYDQYLEDTVFCNNRTIKSLGFLEPNGGSIAGTSNTSLAFIGTYESSLNCDRITDQFSTLNNYAKNNYKIGLITVPEVSKVGCIILNSSKKEFWTMTPHSIENGGNANPNTITSGFAFDYTSNTKGVRPVISLKPGTIYTSGDGSMASPYIIDTTG